MTNDQVPMTNVIRNSQPGAWSSQPGDSGQGTGAKSQGPGASVQNSEVRFQRLRGTRNTDPQIRSLYFALRIRPRTGVTLLEVLFAIMVASVGLLGAIAVFPVAMSQARKGQVADLTAVGADSAVSMVDSGMMRRPDRWLRWDSSAMPPQTAFLPTAFNQSGNAFFGRSYCIDPRFFEYNRLADVKDGQNNSSLWSWFPAVPETSPNPNAIPNASRMLRLTLHNNNPAALTTATSLMSFIQADHVFRIEDQLIYQRPDDNSLPAAQLFTQVQTAAGPPATYVAGRRQEEGRLTWMATLVPKLDRLSGSTGEEFTLSIVVFYDRSPDMEVPNQPNNNVDRPWIEWTAKILGPNSINASGDFHGSGIGGGEVTLTTNDPNQDPYYSGSDQWLDVRRGSWLMLGRTIPTASTPIQYFQWYRVSDAEESARQVQVSNVTRYQRDVTLVGPDWPADVLAADNLPEECDVIIVPSVVHVYERTIKIDTGALQ